MSTQGNTVLHVFRIIGDRRVPYHLELDSTMTVVADRPIIDMISGNLPLPETLTAAVMAASAPGLKEGEEAMANVRAIVQQSLETSVAEGMVAATTAPEILKINPELAQVAAAAKSGKMTEEKLPGGGKRIVFQPSPTDIKVGEWATKLVEVNPIPGTDELRAEFFAAEQALKDKYAADGNQCPNCETGALIRKYRAKLESLGYLQ